MKQKAPQGERPKRRGFSEPEMEPFGAVMEAAERQGLLKDKSSRISGRVSPALIAKAKKRTGIKGDSELIAFALAQLALDDDFADAFKRARGTVDPDIDLEF
ncbi:MAG: hypothetical protein ABL996_13515 [Micropepsaceae bacterium]